MKRLLLAVALLAAACSKNIQSSDAVKQAITGYLNAKSAQTGLNMANIVVEVTALEFDRDSARASVAFRIKGSDQATGMNMNYTLDRKGDQWVVRERAEGGTNPHGGAAPSSLPQGAAPPAEGALPQGHPQVGGAPGAGPSGAPGSGELPPGHPTVGAQHGGGATGSKQ